MNARYNLLIVVAALAMIFVCGAGKLSAQGGQDQTQKPAQQKDKPQQPAAAGGLTLEAQPALAALNPEEEAAFKAYQDAPTSAMAKKLQLGEEFAAKYPQSGHLQNVYSTLVLGYFMTNQLQKLTTVGEKEIALNPNDVNVLAMMCQALPRTYDPKVPNAAQVLDKAEQYGRRAIDVMTMMAKPDNLTDEAFATAKATLLSMAHGGLGLVHVSRGKYADAITELDQAVKLSADPDPVSYYLLGLANEKASHFDDAVTAYSKCAEIPTQMQANCKSHADEAKKKAATQLSVPK